MLKKEIGNIFYEFLIQNCVGYIMYPRINNNISNEPTLTDKLMSICTLCYRNIHYKNLILFSLSIFPKLFYYHETE